jgi:hypothetical protein
MSTRSTDCGMLLLSSASGSKCLCGGLSYQCGANILSLWSSSLKNHGVDDEADGMYDMAAETLSLPLEEKMKFEQGNDGKSFG